MKRLIIIFLIQLNQMALLAGAFVPAKYAGEFLSGGAGARPCGMGGAYTAVVQDVTALYWNPAGLVLINRFQFHGMHAARFSGQVQNDFLGFGFSQDHHTALGLGFYRVGVDGIPKTMLQDPTRPLGIFYRDSQNRLTQNVPVVAGMLRDEEMAFLFSCSRSVSPQWSWGGNIKIIRKQAGDDSAWGLGFDLGLLIFPYRKSRIGVVLQDATSTWVAWNGKRKERILPHLKAGIAYPFQIRKIQLTPAVDADILFENRKQAAEVRMGAVSFDSHAGLEVDVFQRVRFRAGLDRGHLTLGSGLEWSFLCVDYGFMPDEELGNTQRISATISFGQP